MPHFKDLLKAACNAMCGTIKLRPRKRGTSRRDKEDPTMTMPTAEAILPTDGLISADTLRTSFEELVSGLDDEARALAYINHMLLTDSYGVKDQSTSYGYKGKLPVKQDKGGREKMGFIISQILEKPDFFKGHFEKAGIGASIHKEGEGSYILGLHWGAGPLDFPEYYTEEYRNKALWKTELAPSSVEVMNKA